MDLSEIFKIILIVLLIGCAIAVNLTPSLLQAVIIFMSYSSVMCLLWILMESPDLAITEAAVGAGVSGLLFLQTLRKIRREDENAEPGETEPADGRGGADEKRVSKVAGRRYRPYGRHLRRNPGA